MKLPEIKIPKLKTPRLKTSKISAPKVQTPAFLNNLYRDMRDRRLLLPALALIIAVIAVPVALSSSSATTPPPPAPAAAGGSAHEPATSPAVLTEQLGVTNYRERLEQIKSKNPFRKHFTSLPKSAKLGVVSSGATSSTATTTTGTGSSPESPSATSTVAATGGLTTPSGSTTPSAPSSEPPNETPKPTTELIQRRIEVKVGPQGDLQKRTGVKQLKMLPTSNTPVVVFLGTNEAGTRASFLVSTDVTAVSGDGSCLTTTSSCQFLTLKKGQVESFDYAPDTLTYKLKLLAIRDVVVSKTHG
jgi:hypothetical protein